MRSTVLKGAALVAVLVAAAVAGWLLGARRAGSPLPVVVLPTRTVHVGQLQSGVTLPPLRGAR
jgi:hypothetical protein